MQQQRFVLYRSRESLKYFFLENASCTRALSSNRLRNIPNTHYIFHSPGQCFFPGKLIVLSEWMIKVFGCTVCSSKNPLKSCSCLIRAIHINHTVSLISSSNQTHSLIGAFSEYDYCFWSVNHNMHSVLINQRNASIIFGKYAVKTTSNTE